MRDGQRIRDEWLALRCQTGEPGAFEALFAEMRKPLFYYLRQALHNDELAVDVLQETWMCAMKGIPKLKEPGAVRPWLYQMAHGLAVDHIRRDQARKKAEERFSEDFDESAEFDYRGVDAAAIHGALEQLSADHREALALHFVEDFSVAEIAAIVGAPEGTVKSRIHHAKAHMKSILRKGGYGNGSQQPTRQTAGGNTGRGGPAGVP